MVEYILDNNEEIKLLNKGQSVIFSNYLAFTLDASDCTLYGVFNELIYTDQFKKDIDKSMELLTDRTQKILRLRYGLDDGIRHTRAEIAKVVNLSSERVRMIEMSGIRNIKHCNGIKYIKKYTTLYKYVDNKLYEELMIYDLENFLFDETEGMVNKFLNNIGIKMTVNKSPFFIQNKKKGMQLENKPLEELNLDPKLTMCLKRAGYTSLLEILPLKENHDELMRIRNIGIITGKRLTDWIDDYQSKMLDKYYDKETISINLHDEIKTKNFSFSNINTYKIAKVIVDYLKEQYDLIIEDDIEEITKVISFKEGYITKELFDRNIEKINSIKKNYLSIHPLQKDEKMIETYVLYGKCNYKGDDEKTIESLKKSLIACEGSVFNYYKSHERFVDYKKRDSFKSVSQFILHDAIR